MFNKVACASVLFLWAVMQPSAVNAQEGKIHALLVGVTNYPALNLSQQLDGPINDVEMMRETLIQKFRSKDSDLKNSIVSLHEAQPKELRPTYKNIEREFATIANRAVEGDQVFILLSGHGSQDLDDADDSSDDYETDGLDEVFLPRDVIGWNEEKHLVEGAIRDDKINEWLNAIQAKGATVVFVSDSCHSNTQTRGGENEAIKSRRVDLVPKHILDKRVVRRSRGTATEKSPLEGATNASRVGFFAAQSDETTPDGFLEPGTGKKRKWGLLTYTVCQVIKESQGPITYREMGQLIHKKYQYYRNAQIGTNVPTPAMSGTDLDRVFLGNQWQVGRSRLTFDVRNGAFEISGGSIDGLTEGTILKLFPAAGSADANQELGLARIDSVDIRQSFATFVTFDESKKQYQESDVSDSLKDGRCEIHLKDYGRVQITVGLDKSFEGLTDTRQQIIEFSQQDSSPFQIVDAQEAEFVLSVDGVDDDAWITLTRPDKALATVADFDLGPVDASTLKRVEAAFKRIWRAKSLTDLAMRMPPFNAESSQYGGNISVEVVAEMGVKDEQGKFVFKPVDLAGGESLEVDAQVRFKVKNYSTSEVNVTLLYVSDSYQIVSFMPSNAIKSNTIAAAKNGEPQASPLIGPFPVKAHSRIFENMVVIATRANETMSAKSDYTYLAQGQLSAIWENPQVRSVVRGNVPVTAWASTRSKSASASTMSPLDQLLDDSGFNASKTRGLGGAMVKDHSIGIVTWKSARPQQQLDEPSIGVQKEFENQFMQSEQGPWPDKPIASRSKTRGAGESVYPKAAPAIVVVRTDSGHGTGFVISEDGWILTNHHVVADATINPSTGARVAKIHFGKLDDGWMSLVENSVDAEIYKWDKEKDLALLKLSETPKGIDKLPTIPIAKSIPSPGSDCIAIGHPSSGTLWTLRTGDIAGLATWPSEQMDFIMERMSLRASKRSELEKFFANAPKQKILYSTCGLNPGDSGGPLLNKNGELIAVNFAIPAEVRDDKFSFHVHLSEAKQFIADKPNAPLIEEPSTEDEDWSTFELADLTTDGFEETVVLESESNLGYLVDLDENSNRKDIRKADSYEEVAEIWDAELAVYLRNGVECFYDTDNDGEFDLWLIDNDRDPEADIVWVRRNGDWEIGQLGGLKMFDIEHFKSNKKKLAKPFDKTSRAIIRFLVN